MEPDECREPVTKEVRFLVPIEKSDCEPKRITYGVVLEPDSEDLQGDVIAAEDIEKAAYEWMERSQAGGHMHCETVDGAKVVESYIAPCDIPVETAGGPETIRKGSWVLGMRWPENIWKRITDGELTGYSVGGTGVRLELEDVGKAGEWAPGPNANWRRLDESERDAGGADRGRAQATKPRESAEDAYARETLRSVGMVDDIEDRLQDMPAPDDDFTPDWGHAGTAAEIDNELGSVLGFLTGDEDAYAQSQTAPPNFKSAEDAYFARMLSAFGRVERIRERLQDQRAPSEDFAPDWGHVGDVTEVSRRLEEIQNLLGASRKESK